MYFILTFFQLGNFLLNFLSQNPTLAHYLILDLCHVFSLITKLSWFDHDDFKNPLPDINKFLNVCFPLN
jgi:hypothetical protein